MTAMEEERQPVFRFKHPFTCLVCGPTQSGKTHFVANLVAERRRVINPPPAVIIWCFGEYTRDLAALERDFGVRVVDGLDELREVLAERAVASAPALVVLDDVMGEAGDSREVRDLFTRGSHHRDLSVVLVTQNAFHQGKAMRSISLNSQYIVLLKNPRDAGQARYLGQQLFPGRARFFADAYKQATARPHGYLLLDLTQGASDDMRVLSDVLPGQTGYYYVPTKRRSTATL